MTEAPEMMQKKHACDAVEESRELLNSVSSYLWRNPELALQEHKAHDMLSEVLEKAGFSVTRKFVLPTGFRATFGSSPDTRPHVALMCEFDALPELGHACGHNLIAEVAVGAGIGIKAAMEKFGIQGRVTVLGTPAEEAHGGKIDMIKHGFFNDVDAAMMAHPCRQTVAFEYSLCCCVVQATFTGRASHAASSPWDGANALDAAVTAYQSISNLRQQMKPEWRVHGIVKEGGQRPNIIPDRTVVEYYIRCPTKKELAVLRPKVEACFRAAATATGCQVALEQTEQSYDNVVANAPLLRSYTENLKALSVPFEAESNEGGSTDMGNVSYIVPAIHPMFTVGGAGDVDNHTQEFTRLAGEPEAQPHTIAQAKALAMTGVDILQDPGLLDDCRKAFRQDMLRCKGE